VPERFNDQSGETIGYKHEVLLPVTVEAGDASAVKLGLEMFFGVCREVCIPVQAEATIEFGTMMADPLGSARVEAARPAVPVAGQAVKSARLAEDGGKPALVLSLAQKADDVFVESATSAYFGAPRFSADGLEAKLPVSNVKDVKTLAGKDVRITLRSKNTGLEQTLALP
jgi:DsbC/DsbD-like thiol-disulfide interchange protein